MATKDFLRSDGLQNFIHPILAPMSEPEIMINMISRPLKAKKARTGYEAYLDNPESAVSVTGKPKLQKMTFKDSTGANKSYQFRFVNKEVYAKEIGSGGSTWGTSIFTFTNHPGSIHAVPYVNALFLFSTDGTNELHYIHLDGSDALEVLEETAAEVPTNPTWGAVLFNALFTNDQDASYRLRRSCIGYGTSATIGAPVTPFDTHQWEQDDNDPATARFYDIDPYSNGTIYGIHNINNRMVVFMASPTGEMGMYRFDGNSVMQIPTNVSIRPGGADTIKTSADGSAHFANNLGVYQYGGDRPKRVSLALGDEAEDIAPSAAVEFEDLYLLALDNEVTVEREGVSFTLSNPIIVRDLIADELCWWDTAHRMTGFLSLATSATDQPQLYSIDEDGNTYLWNNNNDDAGTAINTALGFRAYYGTTITKPLALTALYTVCNNPGAQRVQVKRHEDDRYSEAETITDKIQQIRVGDIAHTRSLSVLVTGNSRGDRYDYYGHSFDYIEEKQPSGSGL